MFKRMLMLVFSCVLFLTINGCYVVEGNYRTDPVTGEQVYIGPDVDVYVAPPPLIFGPPVPPRGPRGPVFGPGPRGPRGPAPGMGMPRGAGGMPRGGGMGMPRGGGGMPRGGGGPRR